MQPCKKCLQIERQQKNAFDQEGRKLLARQVRALESISDALQFVCTTIKEEQARRG